MLCSLLYIVYCNVLYNALNYTFLYSIYFYVQCCTIYCTILNSIIHFHVYMKSTIHLLHCMYNNAQCTAKALYCTVLYCTVLHCTVLYCTVLYRTILYCTLQLYCSVLLFTVLSVCVLYIIYSRLVHIRSDQHWVYNHIRNPIQLYRNITLLSI